MPVNYWHRNAADKKRRKKECLLSIHVTYKNKLLGHLHSEIIQNYEIFDRTMNFYIVFGFPVKFYRKIQLERSFDIQNV